MEYLPPEEILRPLRVPYKILMGPGPSNSSPRVLHAMSRPVLGHMHSETFQIMDDIKKGIQYIFQTKNELTLAVSASGHGAMEAVLCNLLEPNDKLLVTVNGLWGERIADMANRCGAVVRKLPKNSYIGDNFSLAEIQHAIEEFRPKVFFTVQGDSSTGVYQPLEGIGDICRRYNCLFAVDTVASLGAVPVFADKYRIDAIYTGSQKVLGVPPGLAPISFSDAARNAIFKRRTPVTSYYFDMTLLGQQWNCFQGKPRLYHHTVSSNLLAALREGLSKIAREGMENVIQRHQDCARQLYIGLETLGFELFVEEEYKRLPTVTTVKIPVEVNWQRLVAYAMQKHLMEISGGLGPTTGKVLRIGLMGYNAHPENVKLVLKVLEESLRHLHDTKMSKL